MRMSFKDILWQYARRLADIDKAYDVNLESLKLPTIITADPRTKLTVQNMLCVKEFQKYSPIPKIVAFETL